MGGMKVWRTPGGHVWVESRRYEWRAYAGSLGDGRVEAVLERLNKRTGLADIIVVAR